VRSSISNSDVHLTRRWLPGGSWFVPCLMGLLVAAAAVAGLEVVLASRGYVPTIVDSPAVWARERSRVGELGARAIVLVGASRMQLDVDLPTLRQLTGKEPVQLAIDGGSFVPVLADLAADESVKGTVLVDYYDDAVGELATGGGVQLELAEWTTRRSRSAQFNFSASEEWLAGIVRRYLRSYADGASPFDSVTLRALEPKATPQYLVTLPSRERKADYRKVDMPAFYYKRVARNLGLVPPVPGLAWTQVDQTLRRAVADLPVAALPLFGTGAQAIAGMVRRIEARGGRVIFVAMPTSGLVRDIDERKFPRSLYWDRFSAMVPTWSVRSSDVPALARFVCPDGSHLDMRDQLDFTRALVRALPKDNLNETGSGKAL